MRWQNKPLRLAPDDLARPWSCRIGICGLWKAGTARKKNSLEKLLNSKLVSLGLRFLLRSLVYR